MKFNLEEQLAEELSLEIGQVNRTIKLLKDGNTIPFIARYRKEATGKLDEVTLRDLKARWEYLEKLQQRKEEVIASIAKQDKLTAELEAKINQVAKLQELEDIYRPYRPKRRTRATMAKEKGLEPLASKFLEQKVESGSIKEICSEYLDSEQDLSSIEDVLQGVRDIVAEYVADQAVSRRLARQITLDEGQLVSKSKVDEQQTDYEIYYDYQEQIQKVPPYRVLAINRGEEEDILQVKVTSNDEKIINKLENQFITGDSIFKEELKLAIEDAYYRLVGPAIEREIRSHLTDKAEEHAIDVFSKNLRNLLLQPPLKNSKVLAIDPAFRTGCKIAVLDCFGELLVTETIYPHKPQNRKQEAKEILTDLINGHQLNTIAIGNGTACRETEQLVTELIQELELDLKYIIVNEAGASVYSASKLAGVEFPELDVAMRGAISIGRRLQDPLAELVKIDPKHIGVGMYQHDINQSRLEEALETVVESVVNYVGVDLNSASSALLGYVAGINSGVADYIIEYREENKGFKNREELKEVYRLGPKTFTQAAGFLKIKDGVNLLDETAIHPESYQIAEQLLKRFNFELKDLKNKSALKELKQSLKDCALVDISEELKVGLPTLKDIKESLLKPGRDPRDKLPKPIFKEEILAIEDLKPDMILSGTVRNVVDFGAFVDIGVKEDGLVHISKLSAQYITDPLEVVGVGDNVEVKVLEVDSSRGRISLTMDF
ncbi:RNA-binding transcriptional accessory protein [Natroniella sulfidigena]|uniref:Tex family protein n=1 Tax=Natroniella sulfidigena TaxID=723921 RepID=UPI00200AC8B7|nr:Tex family protein [Natroniella sulfidigena]MCK8817004.1 RNA-binding transcriptional accessory protein [Natroniella sulfidigena]